MAYNPDALKNFSLADLQRFINSAAVHPQNLFRPIAVKHPDGCPVLAGDLAPGFVYSFEVSGPAAGGIRRKSAPGRAKQSGSGKATGRASKARQKGSKKTVK